MQLTEDHVNRLAPDIASAQAGKAQAFLTTHRPDIILIEGPGEIDTLITWLGHEETIPFVAVLAYDKDQPQRGTFYPFAVFSPEWQALRFGIEHDIPVRFIDLPLMHSLALNVPGAERAGSLEEEKPQETPDPHPFEQLASIAGYEDGES